MLLALAGADGGIAAGCCATPASTPRTYVGGSSPRGQRRRLLGDADAAALKEIGIDLDAVRAKWRRRSARVRCARPPEREAASAGACGATCGGTFSPRAKKVLELSLREALRLKHNYIGTEHILLGLIREGDGLGALVLTDAGVNLDDLRERVHTALRAVA